MGDTPRHHRRTRAGRSVPARDLIVLTTALALIVAPLIVIVPHGPTAQATASASIPAEIAAHGHK